MTTQNKLHNICLSDTNKVVGTCANLNYNCSVFIYDIHIYTRTYVCICMYEIYDNSVPK